ncbi:MAG: hypothetical protein EA348_02560, partial [Pseudomonadaceae bacterium]
WMPVPAAASWWQDLWQRPDQQAMQLLAQEQPGAAAERFEHPGWRAWAWHADGDYARAASAWARLIAETPDNPDYHFNHGTSLALAGRYTAALEAFEQALTRAPDHQAARHNRARVEAYLESLKPEEDADPQDQATDADTHQEQTQTPNDSGQDATEPLPEAGTSPENGTDAGGPSETAPDASSAAPEVTAEPATAEPQPIPLTGTERSMTREQEAQRRWLQEIDDNPGELLRRKFRHEYQLMQESP